MCPSDVQMQEPGWEGIPLSDCGVRVGLVIPVSDAQMPFCAALERARLTESLILRGCFPHLKKRPCPSCSDTGQPLIYFLSLDLLVLAFHINETVYSVAICVWLLSPSIMFSGSSVL